MYVMSDLSPDLVTGNVINGSVACGEVIGPTTEAIPEPATVALLSLGSALLRRKRK